MGSFDDRPDANRYHRKWKTTWDTAPGKLSIESVRAIKTLLETTDWPYVKIAKEVGVKAKTVCRINTEGHYKSVMKENGEPYSLPRLGRRFRGCSKLADSEVVEIRKLLLEGHSGVELAKQFDVTRATITNIKKNKVYTWIK